MQTFAARHLSVSPHVLHRGAVASLVGIWAMMVVAGELEEKCASFEQYLATQVPQSRGNVLKSLTTVSCMSESVCMGRVSRKLITIPPLPYFPPSYLPLLSLSPPPLQGTPVRSTHRKTSPGSEFFDE